MSIVYNTSTVKDGLVLHLDAANVKSYPGSGSTWYDLSGNGYNASIFGSNTWISSFGGMFDFGTIAQTTDGIELPAIAARQTSSNYTLEYWMRPSSSGTNYFSSMSDGTNHNYFLMTKGTNTLSKWSNGSGSISFSNNEFLQLAIVRNGSDTGTLYKNGGLEAVASTGITTINSVVDNGWQLNQEQDAVGGGFVAGENFFGAFISVRLYDRALSQEEITKNFNALRGRYGI